jgi:type I restriction enzyme R subunit
VKKVARDLLEKFAGSTRGRPVAGEAADAGSVQSTIRFTLNELPEEPYPELAWNEKVDAVWAFIRDRRQGQSANLER